MRLALFPFLLAALAANPLPSDAAPPPNWTHLQQVKPGATLLVYGLSSANPFAPVVAPDRCTLLHVDATALTCVPEGYAGTRLLFPAAEVDRVFEVRAKRFPFGAVLALAVAGILLGGLLAGSPTAIMIALAGTVFGFIATAPPPPSWGPYPAIYGPPPPPPPPERVVLVYDRVARP